MQPAAAVGEVEVDRLHGVEARRAAVPDVRPVYLTIPQVRRLEHRHWRLAGVKHAVLQEFGGQRIDQGLRLHRALADPLRQRRACDRQPLALEDRFQAVRRQGSSYLATRTWASTPATR